MHLTVCLLLQNMPFQVGVCVCVAIACRELMPDPNIEHLRNSAGSAFQRREVVFPLFYLLVHKLPLASQEFCENLFKLKGQICSLITFYLILCVWAHVHAPVHAYTHHVTHMEIREQPVESGLSYHVGFGNKTWGVRSLCYSAISPAPKPLNILCVYMHLSHAMHVACGSC